MGSSKFFVQYSNPLWIIIIRQKSYNNITYSNVIIQYA